MHISFGSSPRVRGTRLDAEDRTGVVRFIPARAGNTSPRETLRPEYTVHPRACGEHDQPQIGIHAAVGSSPRVRGTPDPSRSSLLLLRFIPARAGNTSCSASSVLTWPVHPRACGEHTGGLGVRSSRNGSSPRVRGTRHQPDPEPSEHRFIPARAGNTWSLGSARGRLPVHPRACGEHTACNSLIQRKNADAAPTTGVPALLCFTLRLSKILPARLAALAEMPPASSRQIPRASGD